MQTLDICPHQFSDIQKGKKNYTIFWGRQSIETGPMCYINHADPDLSLTVWITEVTKMPLASVSEYINEEKQHTGEILFSRIHRYYPSIQLDSEVNVIHHLPQEVALRLFERVNLHLVTKENKVTEGSLAALVLKSRKFRNHTKSSR